MIATLVNLPWQFWGGLGVAAICAVLLRLVSCLARTEAEENQSEWFV